MSLILSLYLSLVRRQSVFVYVWQLLSPNVNRNYPIHEIRLDNKITFNRCTRLRKCNGSRKALKTQDLTFYKRLQIISEKSNKWDNLSVLKRS